MPEPSSSSNEGFWLISVGIVVGKQLVVVVEEVLEMSFTKGTAIEVEELWRVLFAKEVVVRLRTC